jgi:hypothetical protein
MNHYKINKQDILTKDQIIDLLPRDYSTNWKDYLPLYSAILGMKGFFTLVKAEKGYDLLSFNSEVNFPWIIAPTTVDWTYYSEIKDFFKVANNFQDSGDYIEFDSNLELTFNYQEISFD